MSMTDPIADMLTRVRNANMVYHDKVDIPGSNVKRAIAQILKEEGYIRDYHYIEDGKQGIIRIYLKYGPDISKPGLRVYAKANEVPRVLGGLGIAVLSTSHGVMTDRAARRQGIGGEVICYVW